MEASAFVRELGLKGPLVVAPMAGGPTTPALVAAVCNAGALGTLGAAYLQPAEIEQVIMKTREMTGRPFAVNLFTPMPEVRLTAAELERAVAGTRGFRRELGLPDPEVKPPFHPDFERQFEVVLRTKAFGGFF